MTRRQATTRTVYGAYAGAFLKNLQFFGALAVPFFIDWLRVDYTRLFLLQAWFLLWVFLLEIPTGVIADRFGRRISVGLGCLLFAADMLVFGLVRQYEVLYLGEFLGAVGITLISGAEQAFLYDTLVALGREDRARHYFARYEAAGTAGLVAALPIGSYVGTLGTYPERIPVAFLATAAATALAALTFLSLGEPPRVKPRVGFLKMGIGGLRTLLGRRVLRGYVINAVTISAVTFFAFWLYQPACQRAGLNVAHLGLVAAGFNVFATVLLGHVPLLERTFGLGRLLFLTALVPGLLFLALGAVDRLAFVVLAFFVIVGCKMVRMPILNDFINHQIESGNRATIISSVSLLERSVTFAMYPIVGGLADLSLDAAFLFLGGLCVALAVLTRVGSVQVPVAAAMPALAAAGRPAGRTDEMGVQ